MLIVGNNPGITSTSLFCTGHKVSYQWGKNKVRVERTDRWRDKKRNRKDHFGIKVNQEILGSPQILGKAENWEIRYLEKSRTITASWTVKVDTDDLRAEKENQ